MNNTLYLKIERCRDCFFHANDKAYTIWCHYDWFLSYRQAIGASISQCAEYDARREMIPLHERGKEARPIGNQYSAAGADHDLIPDWCPIIVARLEQLYKQILGSGHYFRITGFIDQQKTEAAKEGFWYGKEHAEHVVRLGEYFLNELRKDLLWEGRITEKDIWLFKIAALLHNIGIFRVSANYAAKSAEMAHDFLGDRTLISQNDADVIIHAIEQHSDGEELNTIVDAALFLAGKLDMAADRIKPDHIESGELSSLQQEMLKIGLVELAVAKGPGDVSDRVAELRYQTVGIFDPKVLTECPQCIAGPRKVALDYLKCSEFKFTINGCLIDYETIIN